jgi:hypothetical protein
LRDRQKIDARRQKRKQLIVNRLRQTALRLRKSIKMPKTYEDYKRELRENRDEIELTGSSKTYWRNLAKLLGKEKAAQRRKKAIDQRAKIRCANKEEVAVEVDKKRELNESLTYFLRNANQCIC